MIGKKDSEDITETKTPELRKTLRSYKIMAIVLGVIAVANLGIALVLWSDERSASIQTAFFAAFFFAYGTYVQVTKVGPRQSELASR